jgi:hypothetical protein
MQPVDDRVVQVGELGGEVGRLLTHDRHEEYDGGGNDPAQHHEREDGSQQAGDSQALEGVDDRIEDQGQTAGEGKREPDDADRVRHSPQNPHEGEDADGRPDDESEPAQALRSNHSP